MYLTLTFFHFISDFDDGLPDYATDHPQTEFDTKMPSGAQAWGLAATAPAFSRPHGDASGLCTFLRMVLGMKLWMTALPKNGKTLPGKKGWNYDDFVWQATLLKVNDDL